MEVSEFIDLFTTDLQKEVEGVWVEYGKGVEWKIARAGNDEHARLQRSMARANQALFNMSDEASQEAQQKLIQRLYAQAILKDVRGLTMNGEEVKYTVDLGLKALAKKDFFDWVHSHAKQMEAYQTQAEDEAVKN
jgi:hypothetical protein